MAKARPIGELSGKEPMGLGAARIVRVRTSELADHSREVLELGEVDHLHDMRVATRRLRAALEVFEPCFPGKAHASVLDAVKDLADALGERRDRDVAIVSLQEFSQGLAAPDRPGVRSLVETLRREQIEANEALRPYVAPERLASLCERLYELADEAANRGGQAPAEAPAPERLTEASAENGAGTHENGAGGLQ
jgi:CHAD domain-containing protein